MDSDRFKRYLEKKEHAKKLHQDIQIKKKSLNYNILTGEWPILVGF